MTLALDSPLRAVRGVGPAGERALGAGGIAVVRDLLWRLPYRYEDRSSPRPIASLVAPEAAVTIVGRLVGLVERRARFRRLSVVEAVVDDGTGSLPVVWFNQPYLASSLGEGKKAWLWGPVRPSPRGWGIQMVAPEWEVEDEDEAPVHLGRIVPVYRRIGSWSGRRLRGLISRVLEQLETPPDTLLEFLPKGLDVLPLGAALAEVHFPSAHGSARELESLWRAIAARRTPAFRRLVLDELVGLALTLEAAAERRRGQRAPVCSITDEVREQARQVLPFRLTAAQRRVLGEIVADLQRPFPMARLLQGDVGSGKTVVAALAALVTLASGHQVALLAPTELLAQQHYDTLGRMLGPTPYHPVLLIGSRRSAEKDSIRASLAAGDSRLVVGTHALIEDSVVFERLGLAIIDEQHRFGVAQRQALLDKGSGPHLLVMTATPIPRSLALSLYGDLDVSVLDELPPGRRPVRTAVRDDSARSRLAQFLAREIGGGGQVYWVFPVIEQSTRTSLRAVESHVRAVEASLPTARIGVVHGRLRAAEREAVMTAFARHDLDVLCATTVIEVGVDVPNASVMVIENAERFGLAQLHQLRGRVGRGVRRSFCVLLAGQDCAGDALARLRFLAGTADGFEVAEEDFRSRGSGELTGMRQWGRAELAIANLQWHREELEQARAVAAAAARSGSLDRIAASLGQPRPGPEVGSA